MSWTRGTLSASAWVCMACGGGPGDGGAGWPVAGPALPDLRALHRGLTSGQGSGPPIFVDVLARITPPSTGSDSDTDAGLQVVELRRAATPPAISRRGVPSPSLERFMDAVETPRQWSGGA